MHCIDKNAPEVTCQVKSKLMKEPLLTQGLIRCQSKQKKLYKKTLKINEDSVTMDNVEHYKNNQCSATLQKSSKTDTLL